jgi:hypothetical protein
MPNRPAKLWVKDKTAAALLDMKPAEFLSLVECGALPKPRDFHGHIRWRVAELDAIGDGGAMDEEDFEP